MPLEQLPIAIVDGEVGNVRVVVLDFNVEDRAAVVPNKDVTQRPIDKAFVGIGSSVHEFSSRRVVAAVLSRVAITGKFARRDARKIVVQGRSQQPHLPREVPRSLREDDRVGADRAVAVKTTVTQAELKFLRAL